MGGGIGMGNTCKPMAVSFQCMTKFTTNKKKRKKKEKKKKKKRKKKRQSLSGSRVISGLCYDLLEIGGSLANILITWKFCWQSDHFRKMLLRKH